MKPSLPRHGVSPTLFWHSPVCCLPDIIPHLPICSVDHRSLFEEAKASWKQPCFVFVYAWCFILQNSLGSQFQKDEPFWKLLLLFFLFLCQCFAFYPVFSWTLRDKQAWWWLISIASLTGLGLFHRPLSGLSVRVFPERLNRGGNPHLSEDGTIHKLGPQPEHTGKKRVRVPLLPDVDGMWPASSGSLPHLPITVDCILSSHRPQQTPSPSGASARNSVTTNSKVTNTGLHQ